MRVFLGSSSEAKQVMHEIASWLPRGWASPWDEPGLFQHGQSTWHEINRLANEVDGAIFVFAEDDFSQIRNKDHRTTRDNVLLEYGLFFGIMGKDDRVRVIVTGNPRRASDLLGITLLHVPVFQPGGASVSINQKNAESEIRKWAKKLTPRVLRGLTNEIREHLAPLPQQEVGEILTSLAPRFLARTDSGEIHALCSNKGAFGKEYYGRQFAWVKANTKKVRRLKRVFVRTRGTAGRSQGFSTDELAGIRLHLLADTPKVQIRWVWHDDPLLDQPHGDSLGFAYLGKNWLVHWGVKSGYCSLDSEDRAIPEMLDDHFNELWSKARDFYQEMLKKMYDENFAIKYAEAPTINTR